MTERLDFEPAQAESKQLPKTLPTSPDGFRRTMSLHLNYGSKGASAVFSVFAPDGTQLPITYAYRTGKGGVYESRGFYLDRGEECLTWEELRKRWPAWVKARARIAASGKSPENVMKHVTNEQPLEMFVIYDRPHDSPDGFFVRSWKVLPGIVAPGKAVGRDLQTLDDARALVPSGLVNIGRMDDDDAKIVEVWV